MGSSEEIYWNMAKNNRKLDAKMPSCPHCVYFLTQTYITYYQIYTLIFIYFPKFKKQPFFRFFLFNVMPNAAFTDLYR